MFQYTKENILNSVTENTFKVVTDNGVKKLVVDGLGEYVINNIVGGKIYKTEGQPGVCGKKTITVPEVTTEKILTFRVVTPNQYLAEYASPNWQVFGKPIVVGFNKTADLVESVKLAIPDGNKFIKVGGSGTALTIEGTTPYMDIDKVYLIDAESGDASKLEVAETVERKEPFATKEWIIENLRFPTYPNIRYNSVGNVPTAELYDELAFTYRVPRVGLGGLSGVGQALDAVTRHIFYVPAGTVTTITGLTIDIDDDAEDDTPMLDVELPEDNTEASEDNTEETGE